MSEGAVDGIVEYIALGRGNAAFEVAQHIYDVTSFIHMVSRSRVRNAYATHYVGDLRWVTAYRTIGNQLFLLRFS